MKNGILMITIVCMAGMVGCGDKVPLQGKVTFSDDGSPLTIGMVCLNREGYLARGVLKPDGTFRISSIGKNDGLKPGTYRVSVVGANEDVTPMQIYSLVDPKFTSGDTSGITLTVDSKIRVFDFQVDRNPEPRPKTKK